MRETKKRTTAKQGNFIPGFQAARRAFMYTFEILRLFEITCRWAFSMAAAVHHLGGLPVAPLYK